MPDRNDASRAALIVCEARAAIAKIQDRLK